MMMVMRFGVVGLKILDKNAPLSVKVAVALMSLSTRCVLFPFSPVVV